MGLSVFDIAEFYETQLGSETAKIIQQKLFKTWSSFSFEEIILIYGYSRFFQEYLRSVPAKQFSFIHGQQGAIKYPDDPYETILVDEENLPLCNESIDRIFAIHTLEHSQNHNKFIREIWRVLKGSGRLLLIVPNRLSYWSHSDITPFGHGQPFTLRQLENFLKTHSFKINTYEYLHNFYPTSKPWVKNLHSFFPNICKKYSGLIAIEAQKELYAEISLSSISQRAYQLKQSS